MSIPLRLLIFIIVLTPFITELRLGGDYFYSESSLLKLVFSGIGILLVLFLFLLDGVKKSIIKLYYVKPFFPVALFIFWCFITLFWVSDYVLAGELLAQFSIYVIALIVIVNLVQSFKHLKLVLIWLVVSLVGVSIIGLLQYYFPDNNFIQQVFLQTATPGSTFVNKNMASHFIVMTLPISIILSIATNARSKVAAYGFSTAIGSWFLIYTIARQAYVAIAVEILILLLFFIIDHLKNSSQSIFSSITLKKDKSIALAVIMVFLVFASNFTNKGWGGEDKVGRIQSIVLDADANNSRLPAWVNTIQMIKDNPMTGVGVGQWGIEYPLYYDNTLKDVIFNEKTRAKKLHNDYLEMLANVGLIGYGFLLWLAYLIINQTWGILKNPLNKYRLHYLAIALGMVGFSVVALFSFPIGVYFPALLLFIYIGLLWFEGKRTIILRKKGLLYFYIVMTIIAILIASAYSYKHLLSKHYVRFINESIVDNIFLHDYNHLKKSLKLMPESWITNQSMGRLLLVNDQPEKSIPYLLKAKNIKPYHSFTALNLAQSYEKSNDHTHEKKVLESILIYDHRNIRAWGRLVQIYVKNKNKRKANNAYKNMKMSFEYFKNRVGFGPYYGLVISVSLYVGDYNYTKYIYDSLIKAYPVASNYRDYGLFKYKHMDDFLSAKELLLRAIKLDPNINLPKQIKTDLKL